MLDRFIILSSFISFYFQFPKLSPSKSHTQTSSCMKGDDEGGAHTCHNNPRHGPVSPYWGLLARKRVGEAPWLDLLLLRGQPVAHNGRGRVEVKLWRLSSSWIWHEYEYEYDMIDFEDVRRTSVTRKEASSSMGNVMTFWRTQYAARMLWERGCLSGRTEWHSVTVTKAGSDSRGNVTRSSLLLSVTEKKSCSSTLNQLNQLLVYFLVMLWIFCLKDRKRTFHVLKIPANPLPFLTGECYLDRKWKNYSIKTNRCWSIEKIYCMYYLYYFFYCTVSASRVTYVHCTVLIVRNTCWGPLGMRAWRPLWRVTRRSSPWQGARWWWDLARSWSAAPPPTGPSVYTDLSWSSSTWRAVSSAPVALARSIAKLLINVFQPSDLFVV